MGRCQPATAPRARIAWIAKGRFAPLRIAAALVVVSLAACSDPGRAPSEEIAAARFVSDDAPYIALVTMVDRRDGRGAHTGLIVNASERVIYDPAGTFGHEDLPERDDVHYGISDRYLDFYERYHARFSHFVHVQRVYVSPAVAEAALRRTKAQGPSPKMFCTVNTGQILRDIPGFESIRPGLFPEGLRRQMAKLPGVEDRFVYEEDREKALPSAQ
ncbi:MAG: hypothetical protein AAF281_13795 [Pseudomonadota bacterium]